MWLQLAKMYMVVFSLADIHSWLHVLCFFVCLFFKIREQNLQDIKTAGPQSQVLCAGTVVERTFTQVSLWTVHMKTSLLQLSWPGDEYVSVMDETSNESIEPN